MSVLDVAVFHVWYWGVERRKEKKRKEKKRMEMKGKKWILISFFFFLRGGRGAGAEGGEVVGRVGSVVNGLLYVHTKEKQIGAKVLQNTYSKRYCEA